MKKFQRINMVYGMLLLIFYFMTTSIFAQETNPKKIIYETDMCFDVDDAGALAILHAMANNGEAEILAVTFNEVHPSGVAAIDAMNTWYGRGDIPVGIYRGNLTNPDGSSYLPYVAKFPHDLEDVDAPSALDVYRQVLAAQPDSSVTIISVGFTNNLNDLLIAEPALVAQKVKELVQMAGGWNDDFNLSRHNLVSASQNVIENWPTPMVISWPGGDILTGDNYEFAPAENPYREAFYRWFGNRFEGRSSWDEMAVLYGVRGLSTYFTSATGGGGRLVNGYTWDWEVGHRFYLQTLLSNQNYVQIIEDLMDQWPLGAHFNVSQSSGWPPFSVDFDASVANVGDNCFIEQYLWDFGDGTNGEGVTVSHEYTEVGLFDVQLTIVDNLGDSLTNVSSIRVSDYIFSPHEYFGNVNNYDMKQPGLWSTRFDSGDLRLHLNNEQRNPDIVEPGYIFIKDSTYTSFTLSITSRTGEEIPEQTRADYTIFFGYQDEDNYNCIQVKYSASRLLVVEKGRSTEIARITEKGIPDESYHQLFIDLYGDRITVFLDDSLFLSKTDNRLFKEGKIGFGSLIYSAFFDNILVTRQESPAAFKPQEKIPSLFEVWQNYPNPFNPSTKIKFSLPNSENVKIEIYDITGKKIKTLLDESLPAGYNEVEFFAQDIMSGVYFYKIEAGKYQKVKKMVLIK